MAKRLVEIDDELLTAAQQASGESTIKGTVTEALQRLVAEHRRREQDLRQRWNALGGALVDLQDDEVMQRAWS